jgi:hypothetical protein
LKELGRKTLNRFLARSSHSSTQHKAQTSKQQTANAANKKPDKQGASSNGNRRKEKKENAFKTAVSKQVKR